MLLRARSFLAVLPLFLLLHGSPAAADAVVVVELKHPDGKSTDGEVQLARGDTKHRCTTEQGRCEIRAVAGGIYTVTVVQPGRPASKGKTVVIPPSGHVKLIVNAP